MSPGCLEWFLLRGISNAERPCATQSPTYDVILLICILQSPTHDANVLPYKHLCNWCSHYFHFQRKYTQSRGIVYIHSNNDTRCMGYVAFGTFGLMSLYDQTASLWVSEMIRHLCTGLAQRNNICQSWQDAIFQQIICWMLPFPVANGHQRPLPEALTWS